MAELSLSGSIVGTASFGPISHETRAEGIALAENGLFVAGSTNGRFPDQPPGGNWDAYVLPLRRGSAPVADAGPDQVVECTAPCVATVVLDGSASNDPDGPNDITQFEWSEGNSMLGTGPILTTILGLGTHAIDLRVVDSAGHTSTDQLWVVVADTKPPTLVCPSDLALPCSVSPLLAADYVAAASDVCDTAPEIGYSHPPGSGFPAGTTEVTASAVDAAGNSSECTFRIVREGLGFTGFLPPVGGADATGGSCFHPLRTFKLGSTIPVKFKTTCGHQPVLEGLHTLEAIRWSNETNSDQPIEPTSQDAATDGNQFRLSGDEWHLNLDTATAGFDVGVWQLTAKLSDGSQHSVWIQLK